MGVSVIRSPAGHYVYPWFALWFSGSPSEYELQAIRALFAYVLACSYLTSCGIRSGTTAFSLYSLVFLVRVVFQRVLAKTKLYRNTTLTDL